VKAASPETVSPSGWSLTTRCIPAFIADVVVAWILARNLVNAFRRRDR
jgi:hypothetical protein